MPHPDPLTESFRLRPDAELHTGDDGTSVLRRSRFELRLGELSAGGRAMVSRLAQGWASDVELIETVGTVDGFAGALAAQLLLRTLTGYRWLARRLGSPGRPLLEVTPRGLGAEGGEAAARHVDGAAYRLSRFTILRAGSGGTGTALVADTPLSTTGVALLDPALAGAVAATAAAPVTAERFADLAGIGRGAAAGVLDALLAAALVVDDEGDVAQRTSMPLAAWSPVDLMLHHRSRAGRHMLPLGGTYPLRGVTPALPLDHVHADTPQVDLPVPDPGLVAEADGSLTEVIDRRRSVRVHGADPLTLAELAEFLYRVQRRTGARTVGDQEEGERPYPGGGALGELEVYPVVHRCAGLEAGVYHYDSGRHRLARLAGPGPDAARVLSFAQAAATMTAPPQVCLVITARVGRIMWKYEGMSYALLLKHAGVLTELMYLVATSMGLAPCAIGTGDSASFAAAAGLDPHAEPSVAEFLLGSPAE